MMKYIYLLWILCLVGAGCNDDSMPEVFPSERGVWVDPDDNYEYGWVRIGDQEWMTSNLKAGTPYWYAEYDLNKYGNWLATTFSKTKQGKEEERTDFEKYGNLYEWETACEVCSKMKDGWRMPTDEDWQKLERALGMSAGEADDNGWRGEGIADLLRQTDEGTELGLQIAGNASFQGAPYDLQVRFVREKGFYWSSTQDEEGKVYYRKLHYNSSKVFRSSTEPLSVPMMRVRCVRDVR